MFDVFVTLGALAFIFTPIAFIVALIKTIRRKVSKKKWWIICLLSFVLMIVFELIAMAFACDHNYTVTEEIPATCTEEGKIVYYCDKCDSEKTEYEDELGHDMRIESRVEPTENLDGEIVRKCERCGYEEVEIVEKLGIVSSEEESVPEASKTIQSENESKEASSTKSNESVKSELPQEQSAVESASSVSESKAEETIRVESKTESNTEVQLDVTFDEIYYAYKENELRADDIYQYNWYRITAKVNGISSGGLFNLTGGATLTLETKIDNTIVFFYAEFEKEQEENLKNINVGDTITFDGKCLSAGSWSECELVTE